MSHSFFFDPKIYFDRAMSHAVCRTADAPDGCGISFSEVNIGVSVVADVRCGAGIQVP